VGGGATVTSLDGTKLPVRTYAPDGAGPFPAVVLLHGCAGWWGSNIGDWGRFLAEHGYYALAIDSFSTRNVDEICSGLASGSNATGRHSRVSAVTRMQDAYGAFDFLAAQTGPAIDARRIAVMGFSHGGSTALTGVQRTAPAFYDRPADRTFAAAIALYPSCQYSLQDWTPRHAPVLIIEGEKDDWTGSGGKCGDWAKRLSTETAPIVYDEIPGATHAFDSFSWRGRPLTPHVNPWGHQLTPNHAATDRAHDDVLTFLKAHL
jgi:dienelactone hydrolase